MAACDRRFANRRRGSRSSIGKSSVNHRFLNHGLDLDLSKFLNVGRLGSEIVSDQVSRESDVGHVGHIPRALIHKPKRFTSGGLRRILGFVWQTNSKAAAISSPAALSRSGALPCGEMNYRGGGQNGHGRGQGADAGRGDGRGVGRGDGRGDGGRWYVGDRNFNNYHEGGPSGTAGDD